MELDLLFGAPVQDLDHHLAAYGAGDDAVAAPELFGGGDDDDVPVAVKRLHGIPGDFQRIGRIVAEAGEPDFVPALPDGKARRIEIAPRAGLCETQERHDPADAGALRVGQPAREQGIETLAGGFKDLGDRFCRRPAFPPILADALGGVEGGGIEAGQLGQSGSGQAVPLGKAVESFPYGAMRQHGQLVSEKGIISNQLGN